MEKEEFIEKNFKESIRLAGKYLKEKGHIANSIILLKLDYTNEILDIKNLDVHQIRKILHNKKMIGYIYMVNGRATNFYNGAVRDIAYIGLCTPKIYKRVNLEHCGKNIIKKELFENRKHKDFLDLFGNYENKYSSKIARDLEGDLDL